MASVPQSSEEPAVCGAIVSCKSPTLKPPQTVPCKHNGLMVTCQHGRFTHVSAELPPPHYAQLEVVAGHEKKFDKVECITDLIEGPCGYHKDHVFDHISRPDDPSAVESQDDTKLVIKAKAMEVLTTQNKFKNLWPISPPLRTYSVFTNTCYGLPLETVIVVYPDIKWEFKIAFGFGSYTDSQKLIKGGTEDGKGTGLGDLATKTLDEEKFNGEFEVKVTTDGSEYSLGADFKKFVSTCFKAVNAAKDVTDFIVPRLQKMGGATITISWPKIELSGNCQWKEIDGSPKCGFEYEIEFGFKPLLGLTGKFDLLTWILNAGGPIGTTINYMRKMAGEDPEGPVGAKVNIYLDFILSGKIDGTFKFKKPADKKTGNYTGQATGEVGFEIKGGGEIEGKIWCVKAGAGAKVGAKASITPSLTAGGDETGSIYLEGKIHFNGLTLYASYWYGVNLSMESKKPKPVETKGGAYDKFDSMTTNQGTTGSGKGGMKTEEKSQKVIGEATWCEGRTIILNNN